MTNSGILGVVIIDDIPESRENLERLLHFEPDLRVLGKAARAEDGIELVLKLHPHVVLLDLTLPDRDGLEAATAITARAPGVGVIVLGVDQDPDILRRAMLAGAREYLAKPFGYDELIEAVRRVGRLANPQATATGWNAGGTIVSTSPGSVAGSPIGENGVRGAQVIAILGSKGGVGRTFVASNLAISWRRLTGEDVILIDGDLVHPDVGVFLNLAPHRSWGDLGRVRGPIERDYLENLLTRHVSEVRVLLGPERPEEAVQIGAEQVQRVLEELRSCAQCLVVDTRGGYDDITLACADAATVLIWVLTLEMSAIRDTKLFLELAERLGYSRKRIVLVLNKVMDTLGLTPEELEHSLRTPIPVRIPADFVAVTRSINEGSPLAWTARQHRIVNEITRLVELLRQDGEGKSLLPSVKRRRLPLLRPGDRG